MLQIVELCRLCGQKKRNKMDLFANDDEETKSLLGKISNCVSVQITREDLLPKMICTDCQRVVEQFSAFRLKCQKAEDKLLKMLSCNPSNKVMITRIKEECLESEFHDPSITNSTQTTESSTFINVKALKNVKSEVIENESDQPCGSDNNSDLIQIISEEIVSHNFVDIKQPIIEIISEDFVDDCKNNQDYTNVKLSENDQVYGKFVNVDVPSLDPAAVIEVKMQVTENELESPAPVNDCMSIKNYNSECKSGRKGVKSKRKDLVESDVEIDEKYFVLSENEECSIDIEEMDAIIKKNQDPNVRFNCGKCKKSFKFFKCLKKHRAIHDNELDTYICDICCNNKAKNYEFSNLKCLKSHITRKHLLFNKEKYECQVCKRCLTSQGQLNAHHRKVHDHLSVSCQVCRKVFKNKTRLKDHLRVHKEERPYVCDQCGQSFKWNNSLKVHIQCHKQEKNFLCSECGKKFSAKKNLIEHLNIHTGNRPHVCQHCSATFIQLSAYSKHMYVHNEKLKVHKCDKCDKAFSHQYLLKQHTLHHTGSRPYACSVCRNSFKSQSDLCTHVKMHEEKMYGCSVCGRKFSRSKTLKDHMVRHTGVKHVCPAPGCGKSYTQRFPLTKHFCKNHPSLTIVNRSGGRKTHLGALTNQENYPCIRYDYTTKDC